MYFILECSKLKFLWYSYQLFSPESTSNNNCIGITCCYMCYIIMNTLWSFLFQHGLFLIHWSNIRSGLMTCFETFYIKGFSLVATKMYCVCRLFLYLTALDWLRPGELQEVPPKNGYFQINFIILARGNFLIKLY